MRRPASVLRVASVAPVALLAVLGAACIPAVEPRAAESLACGEAEISREEYGMTQVVNGCGKKDVLIFDGAQGQWVSLRERAAFELSCAREKLVVTMLDSTTFGVTGCDGKAVYKIDWMHGFVMSSASEGVVVGPKPKGGEPASDDASE